MDVTLDPQLTALAAATTAIGWTMVFAGARKRALELKRRKRICPACGRVIAGRVCDEHRN
jgi:hypothetical protein